MKYGEKFHYENTPIQIYWKFHHQKPENFQIKNFDIFHISAQNIDCGHSLEPPRRCGSNGYPHSMFLSRNKKNNVYPCKPQFYYIKVGFKGGQNYIGMFSWCYGCHAALNINCSENKYTRISMTGTSFGSWKIVRDMGSSSHWRLIIVPDQEANGDNLGMSFPSSIQ